MFLIFQVTSLKPAERVSELEERASDLAGRASEPAGKPAGRTRGGQNQKRKQKRKRRKIPDVVLPLVIVPHGATAHKPGDDSHH